MTETELLAIVRKIPIGAAIQGTIRGKFYAFGGIQTYRPRGRHARLQGTEVVVLLSKERKNSRIIPVLPPLLMLVNAGEGEISHGHLPAAYIETYRSGDTKGIPNIYEYEAHYKSLARHIKGLTEISVGQG